MTNELPDQPTSNMGMTEAEHQAHVAALKHQRDTALDGLAHANAMLHVARQRVRELEEAAAGLKEPKVGR